MKLDQAGIDFIKSFEGFSPVVYKDIRGKFTIGWGHTENVCESTPPVTKEEAEMLLRSDLDATETLLGKILKFKITQWEYNALCSLVFNIGIGNFLNSTLLKRLNAHDMVGASKEFDRWVYYRDPRTGERAISPGLEKRRLLEKELFLAVINLKRSQTVG